MPDIKHQFTGGKMNKDVDERLVPNGEYRDAVNIQVSTSEDSEVGTIQNILGNTPILMPSALAVGSVCVGSVSDEKNDALYWFVREGEQAGTYPAIPVSSFTDGVLNGVYTRRDLILEYKENTVSHVFVDLADTFIRASAGNPATGVIPISTTEGFNKINVGDKLSNPTDFYTGLHSNETFTVLSKNAGSNTVTVGNYTNATFATYQVPTTDTLYFQLNAGTSALNFPKDENGQAKMITAINIIDDLLFWSDGVTEPKKINITRSKDGTNPTGTQHTYLVNNETDPGQTFSNGKVEEKHLTVIKKSPLQTLIIETEDSTQLSVGNNVGTEFSSYANTPNTINGTISVTNNVPLSLGDVIVFNPTTGSLPPHSFVLKVKLVTGNGNGTNGSWKMQVLYQDPNFDISLSESMNFAQIDDRDTFKEKFIKFSYRYKYEDGEYSCFAPFTNVIFSPGAFSYEPKEAYNLGMQNTIRKIVLKNYVPTNIPKDVVQVDLLYKESNSPSVYLIDSIKPNTGFDPNGTNFWENSYNSGYEVKPNMIKSILPENQLLRPFDNVPRNALAQSVTGNRLVYGNYTQNYNTKDYSFRLNTNLVNREIWDRNAGKKSLKSMRDYSFGISYLDKYNRQSPVFSSVNSNINIPISSSSNLNQVEIDLNGSHPWWATHFKVFVKETSNEYYNLALDRVYEARDGNVWLSFPSSDRNKIDKETFLILKKEVGSTENILEKNRHKILAVENEAPEFIKTILAYTAESEQQSTVVVPGTFDDGYYDQAGYEPLKGVKKIRINKGLWLTTEIPLTDIEDDIVIEFTKTDASLNLNFTTQYDVVSVAEGNNGTDYYQFNLETPIKEDFLEDTNAPADIHDSVTLRIYRKILRNSPEFDGRFFVKIERTALVEQKVLTQITDPQYNEVVVDPNIIQFYYIADSASGNTSTTSGLTIPGGTHNGVSSDSQDKWEAILQYGGASIQSGWFIDAAYYDGFYDLTNQTQYGVLDYGMIANYRSFPSTDENDIINHPDSGFPNAATSGYNNGIYEENGQMYIDLSFGAIYNADGRESLHDPVIGNNYVDAANAIIGNYLDYANAYQLLADELYNPQYYNNGESHLKNWRIGSLENPEHHDQLGVIFNLVKNKRFKFRGGDDDIYTITDDPTVRYFVNHTNVTDITPLFTDIYSAAASTSTTALNQACYDFFNEGHDFGHRHNRRVTYKIPIDKDPTVQSFNPIASGEADATNQGAIVFLDYRTVDTDGQLQSNNPAIWETEPKENIDLDIYYEVDGTFPLALNIDTAYDFAPVGTIVNVHNGNGEWVGSTRPPVQTCRVVSWIGSNVVQLDKLADDEFETLPNTWNTNIPLIASFQREDGSCVNAEYLGLVSPTAGANYNTSYRIRIHPTTIAHPIQLSFFNCYSFSNGVESDRIRDDFNEMRIDKGAKASAVLDKPYKREHRKYGLIYSGLYNSTSGVNNLNQFIVAEKITKDINPIYGSIQKLHSRNTDLITLCEDKVLKILANKDAVFNADGNTQLTATKKVLGQAIPFVGEYGISKNPESFASESYRVYFADKVRGSIIRLSKDGLTPISSHGMKRWFRDNLKLNNTIVGSYDDKKDEYNVTLKETSVARWNYGPITVSFKEDVKGWVSFKSFIPENAVSCANEYFTFRQGKIWKHHSGTHRNLFYYSRYDSSVDVILNDFPKSIKSFHSLNYDGSQAKVTEFRTDATTGLTDNEYYNLTEKDGWYVDFIKTDQENGGYIEFIEKEGRWFNYIKGKNPITNPTVGNVIVNTDGSSLFDQASFAIQGLGTFTGGVVSAPIYGCTDPTANNYDSNATIDNGSCTYCVYGCTDPAADNYSSIATCNDGTCIFCGCTDSTALNYDSLATSLCGGGTFACIAVVPGCTDSTAYNYDPLANTDDGNCIAVISGCTNSDAHNWDPTANTEDGSCYWDCEACPGGSPISQTFYESDVDPNTGVNYTGCPAGWYPTGGDPCAFQVGGCTDPTALNFNNAATYDDGSCIAVYTGCTDPLATNYNPNANTDDGSCNYSGCTDPTATNYDPLAVTDDGSCLYVQVYGCLDPTATNYDCIPGNTPVTGSNSCGDGVTVDDGITCTYPQPIYGCTADAGHGQSFWADNYGPTSGNTDYVTNVPGAIYTDLQALNYDASADTENGDCVWCDNTNADNYDNFDNLTLSGSGDEACTFCYGFINQTTVSATDTLDIEIRSGHHAPNYTNLPAGIPSNSFLGAYITQITTTVTNITTASPDYPYTSTTTNTLFDGDYNSLYGYWDISVQAPGIDLDANYEITTVVTCIGGTTYTSVTTEGPGNIIYGCTDSTACNYDATATADHPSQPCEYATCAGCTDPLADPNSYNYQTQQDGTPCLTPGTNVAGPCTISCGDGTDATDQGNGCCQYTVVGCTDATACNYNSAATQDDGTCEFTSCSGCMDSTPGPNPDVYGTYPINPDNTVGGYDANNYDPNATIACGDGTSATPGSPPNNCCDYTAIVTGCMYGGLLVGDHAWWNSSDNGLYPNNAVTPPSAAACNYDPNATVDDGSCIWGFDSVVWNRDYNATGETDATILSQETTQDNRYLGLPPGSTIDLGLDFRSIYLDQYNSGDKIVINLYRHPLVGALQFIKAYSYTNPQTSFASGNTGHPPVTYSWQNNFMAAGATNHIFDVYNSDGSPAIYQFQIYSMIGGQNTANISTGCMHTSTQTPLNIIPCMNQPGAVLGCMDYTACNYDSTATCPDQCTYQTVPWHGIFYTTPAEGNVPYCVQAPCGSGGPGTAYPYASLQECTDAIGSN